MRHWGAVKHNSLHYFKTKDETIKSHGRSRNRSTYLIYILVAIHIQEIMAHGIICPLMYDRCYLQTIKWFNGFSQSVSKSTLWSQDPFCPQSFVSRIFPQTEKRPNFVTFLEFILEAWKLKTFHNTRMWLVHTGSIERSTIIRSQVSTCGKFSRFALYFMRRSQSEAATFVGTRSRPVVVDVESIAADLAARYRT